VSCIGCGAPASAHEAADHAFEPAMDPGEQQTAVAQIALEALARITDILDNDCDETRVALYNPRSTVAEIRKVLEQADAALQVVQS
jgi:hypothetical protein